MDLAKITVHIDAMILEHHTVSKSNSILNLNWLQYTLLILSHLFDWRFLPGSRCSRRVPPFDARTQGIAFFLEPNLAPLLQCFAWLPYLSVAHTSTSQSLEAHIKDEEGTIPLLGPRHYQRLLIMLVHLHSAPVLASEATPSTLYKTSSIHPGIW